MLKAFRLFYYKNMRPSVPKLKYSLKSKLRPELPGWRRSPGPAGFSQKAPLTVTAYRTLTPETQDPRNEKARPNSVEPWPSIVPRGHALGLPSAALGCECFCRFSD